MSKSLYQRLHQQAGGRCGYCRTSSAITGEALTVEHIIPTAKSGANDEANLWISCRRCNQYKRTQIDAIDPETEQRILLFHPRIHSWSEHFVWSDDGTKIVGLTPCGRATVVALQMNHPQIVNARRLWVSVGWHPPNE